MLKQENPFTIKIELTRGCNLQCDFCGVTGFQIKPNSNYSFMTIETAKRLSQSIAHSGWNSRLEFTMHGEPTMNPDWLHIIKIFHQALPKQQIMLTSNGGGIVLSKRIQQTIETFFANGGKILALDDYEGVALVDKIKKKLCEEDLFFNDIDVYTYPEQKQGNPYSRIKGKMLVYLQSIDTILGGARDSLSNHCGSGAAIDKTWYNKRCVKPFREITFNWNGSVSLCCDDFLNEFMVGSIYDNTIEEIWNNKYFHSARKFLYLADRSKLRPCKGCNSKSHRVGLLPDKKGKLSMRKPTQEDHNNVAEATSNGPVMQPTNKAAQNIIPILTKQQKLSWDLIGVLK